MKKRMMIVFLAIILLIVGAALYILPPSRGTLEGYTKKDGAVLENSIAEKSAIDINGHNVGLYILAKDDTKPVLLVCGGGPGIPQFFMESQYPSCLPDEFVVCYFDYYGTGRSYDKSVEAKDITTDFYIEDVVAVTDYLCDRFARDKVYIMGHSFGTYIALNTVARFPEKYEAYLAMSQVCDQQKSERIAYAYMKDEYAKNNNAKMVKQFAKYPIETSYESYEQYRRSSLRDKAMHELGIGTTRNMDSVISGIFWPSLHMSEYTPGERIDFWKGKIASNRFAATGEAFDFNAFEDVPQIEVPIYFFAGIYDYTCTYELQKEYYEYIEAPDKRFFTFENSAHSPIYEETEVARKYIEELLNENK